MNFMENILEYSMILDQIHSIVVYREGILFIRTWGSLCYQGPFLNNILMVCEHS